MEKWQPRVAVPSTLVRPVRLPPGRSRSSAWVRTTFGCYVPAGTDRAPVEQRILEQSMRLRGDGAVTGWAALRMQGGGFFDGLAPDGVTVVPVMLVLGVDRIRQHPSVELVLAEEVAVCRGVRCLAPEPALFAEICRAGELREAVVAIDMACAGELTSLARFRAWLAGQRRRPGLALARRALDLAVEDSRSPMETRLRLIWVLDLGWPAPLCNRPVHHVDGPLIGVPDLFDPIHGLAAEFSGADHRGRKVHRNDVRRAAAFRRAGVEAAEFVGADLRDRSLVVQRLLDARGRCGLLPPRWTLTPPREHLVVKAGLDERLDHRDLMLALAEQTDP